MLLGQMTGLYSCIISILSEYRSFPCFADAEDDYKNGKEISVQVQTQR